MIYGENNSKAILIEFEKKAQGIIHCIDCYVKAQNPSLTSSASQILILYCLEGFVGDINAKGRIELIHTIVKNFTSEDEKVRMQAMKLMSLLLTDSAIHDIVLKISDFQFLVGDIEELASYPSLYTEEREILLYAIRIIGEFSRHPKIAEMNITNGMLPCCIKVLSEPTAKFDKEIRLWAFATINRGCQHQANDINVKTIQVCMSTLPPQFLKVVFGIVDPEDVDFTNNGKGIFATLEQMSAQKNTLVLQTFAANAELVEKLLMGAKKTMSSQSDIGANLRNLIVNLRNGSPDCDKIIKESTKRLATRI